MLTPEYLLHVSEGAEEIAARLHTDIVKQIARRVLARQQRGADYILTAADKWRIQSLLDAGYMQDDIAEDIAKATRLEKAEVAEAFRDAGVTATKYDDEVYEAMGLPTGGTQSPYFTRLMQRNYEATMGTWENYARTTADASQQTFISTMDDIYTKVATGSQSYTEAFTEAINKLAETGIVVFYPSGHKDTIETATLRCVRTGISQASAQIQIARMDEFGVDLVVVSSHMGARPSHQVWQGKVYSRSGSSKKYPDFVSSTGYGTGDGLCGWNCRHNFSPYYEGMKNPFDHYTKKENNELYEKTQKQRSMERTIRKTKREAEVLKDAAENAENEETANGLRESAEKARKKLKRQTEAYNQYCRENDLRPLPERLKIAKAGRLSSNGITVPEINSVKPKKIVPAETFEEKIGKIRERVKQNGRATEEDIKEAGRLVRDEVQKTPLGDPAAEESARDELRTLLDRRAELNVEVQNYTDQIEDIILEHVPDPNDILGRIMVQDPRIDELQEKIDKILKSREYKGLEKKIKDLKAKVSAAEGNTFAGKAERLKGVLSRFRKMGHPNVAKGVKSRTDMGKVLQRALDYYPEEWVQYAIDSGGIRVKSVGRGFCNSYDNLIALSGYGGDQTFGTAIHELGHYFERKVSISDTYVPYDSSVTWWKPYVTKQYPEGQTFILDAERAFYKRRTAGEKLEWMGTGYKRDEVTRKDNFVDKYMGKDYGGYDYELVSMGFQYAYTEPEMLAKDPDMEEWIYGILSLF